MRYITYGSACSGIESASVAWEPLGWQPQWFSEIEPFPCAVLQHHWPAVPNHGDMTKLATKILWEQIPAPDVFVAGTPCQAFSVAGLRGGMQDPRGQLTISYIRIADAIDYVRSKNKQPAAVHMWENVPGVLSDKSNAFGCFIAGLVGETQPIEPGKKPATGKSNKHWRWCQKSGNHIPKWTASGVVVGSQRTAAWRTLDAQYFNVAQRRKRVFVIASARAGFNPAAVLFEQNGMRRDTAPSRETRQDITHPIANCLRASGTGTRTIGDLHGQYPVVACFDVAGTLDARTKSGGFPGTDGACNGHVVPVEIYRMQAFGKYEQSQTASTLKMRDYKDATDLVIPIHDKATRSAGQTGKGSGNGIGIGKSSDPSPTLTTGDKHAVFTVHGTQDPCTLNNKAFALGLNNGAENAVLETIGFNPVQDGMGMGNYATPVGASTGGGNQGAVCANNAVRRLTPIECERLQGFPDNHTRIPMRFYKTRKITKLRPVDMWQKAEKGWWLMAADAPRYKAIGNSKAVSVVRWLGHRIESELCKQKIKEVA